MEKEYRLRPRPAADGQRRVDPSARPTPHQAELRRLLEGRERVREAQGHATRKPDGRTEAERDRERRELEKREREYQQRLALAAPLVLAKWQELERLETRMDQARQRERSALDRPDERRLARAERAQVTWEMREFARRERLHLRSAALALEHQAARRNDRLTPATHQHTYRGTITEIDGHRVVQRVRLDGREQLVVHERRNLHAAKQLAAGATVEIRYAGPKVGIVKGWEPAPLQARTPQERVLDRGGMRDRPGR